jgi:carbamoyl-phosphate synthase small subunit
MAEATNTLAPKGATGVLILASGEMLWGKGFGAQGAGVGEVCFNTSMTGYQEIMTDPSYAKQIINFTFPHIGNVGANPEDFEATNPHAIGCIVREDVTDSSNFRSTQHFVDWMKANNRIGLSGIDTRALTRLIRQRGAPNAIIAHFDPDAPFAWDHFLEQVREWPGLEGMDLAKDVTTLQTYGWNEGRWKLGQPQPSPLQGRGTGARRQGEGESGRKVVAIDYGIKRNILRNLVDVGCDVTVVSATASFDESCPTSPKACSSPTAPAIPPRPGTMQSP